MILLISWRISQENILRLLPGWSLATRASGSLQFSCASVWSPVLYRAVDWLLWTRGSLTYLAYWFYLVFFYIPFDRDISHGSLAFSVSSICFAYSILLLCLTSTHNTGDLKQRLAMPDWPAESIDVAEASLGHCFHIHVVSSCFLLFCQMLPRLDWNKT